MKFLNWLWKHRIKIIIAVVIVIILNIVGMALFGIKIYGYLKSILMR